MNIPTNFGRFSKNIYDVEGLRNTWGWFLFLGIALIFLGMMAIGAATAATVVSVEFLGTVLLISGLGQTVYAFWMRQWSGFFISILAGILYSVIGLFLIIHPLQGAISLTLLLSAFYIVGGLFRITASVMSRFEHWGWALFSGIVKFVLGMLILLGWPATGLWVLGLFIGIDLIFFGWFWVLIALTVRKSIT